MSNSVIDKKARQLRSLQMRVDWYEGKNIESLSKDDVIKMQRTLTETLKKLSTKHN